MGLEHVHKVLVMLCLAGLFSAARGAPPVSAGDPPLPKLKITTGTDGSESYCLGQTIEFGALVTDADDTTIRPTLVTVTIVDDTGTRESGTDDMGFVHWQYRPKDEGKHSIRLEAVGGLRLPADPVTFEVHVKKCSWELTLIYVEVSSEDFDEAGGMQFDGSVGFKTTFSSDQDGNIESAKDPGDYQMGISATGEIAGQCQLQGQPSGPIAIAVTGSIANGLDIQLSALPLSVAGTRADCGTIKTDGGEIPVEIFAADSVDLINKTDTNRIILPLEGGSFSKDFGRGLFWPERSYSTATVTVEVTRVDK